MPLPNTMRCSYSASPP